MISKCSHKVSKWPGPGRPFLVLALFFFLSSNWLSGLGWRWLLSKAWTECWQNTSKNWKTESSIKVTWGPPIIVSQIVSSVLKDALKISSIIQSRSDCGYDKINQDGTFSSEIKPLSVQRAEEMALQDRRESYCQGREAWAQAKETTWENISHSPSLDYRKIKWGRSTFRSTRFHYCSWVLLNLGSLKICGPQSGKAEKYCYSCYNKSNRDLYGIGFLIYLLTWQGFFT